jgi:intraflagellar transport protein 56
MLSRAKPALDPNNSAVLEVPKENQKQEPKLENFISRRDFVGAITLLEFYKASGKNTGEIMLWLGYSQFHLGEYHKALETYQEMSQTKDCDPIISLYLGCCYFFLGMYKESDDATQR